MKKYIFSLLFLSVNFLAPFRLSAQPGQQLDHQKNYNYCMHGYSGCDSFSLTDAERTQVQQAARQRNYNSCVHGYAGCDSSQLTDAERTQVQRAARQRNYNNCLHGYAGCDSSQLTETERAEVQQAAHQRNYNNCLQATAPTQHWSKYNSPLLYEQGRGARSISNLLRYESSGGNGAMPRWNIQLQPKSPGDMFPPRRSR